MSHYSQIAERVVDPIKIECVVDRKKNKAEGDEWRDYSADA